MNVRVPKPADPRLGLSFFRRATRQETETGATGYVSWSVASTGKHSADIERGKAIAEEALSFMAAHPTYGHLMLIADMLREAHRQADEAHRSLLIGFGMRLGQIATMGVSAVGMDAIRAAEVGADKAA